MEHLGVCGNAISSGKQLLVEHLPCLDNQSLFFQKQNVFRIAYLLVYLFRVLPKGTNFLSKSWKRQGKRASEPELPSLCVCQSQRVTLLSWKYSILQVRIKIPAVLVNSSNIYLFIEFKKRGGGLNWEWVRNIFVLQERNCNLSRRPCNSWIKATVVSLDASSSYWAWWGDLTLKSWSRKMHFLAVSALIVVIMLSEIWQSLLNHQWIVLNDLYTNKLVDLGFS